MSLQTEAGLLSGRIGRIEISATMAVTAEAAALRAQGANLADFGAGEPHFPTPRHIKDAAIAAIESNFTRYTAVSGIPELRKAIVDRHCCDFGSDYRAEEAIFTTGVKLAIFQAIQVLVDHGDEVILPVPYWVSFKDIVEYSGGRPVYLQTEGTDDFRITAESVEKLVTSRTRAIIVNSPCNPSGSVVSNSDLERIVRFAQERSIYLLLDECSVYLRYGGAPVSGGSFAQSRDHVVVVGSLSKTYAMTGWRAGFALGPKPIIAAMSKLQSQSTSSAASIVQKAAVAALNGPQECVAEMRAEYLRLRDGILAGMAEMPGISCRAPQGAFYVFPDVSGLLRKTGIASSAELARRLLHEAHVVTVPGEAFGAPGRIRLSYAVSQNTLRDGLARMKEFFAGLA